MSIDVLIEVERAPYDSAIRNIVERERRDCCSY